MRVRGNVSPDVLHIEPYHPMDGYVEVRVRENINTLQITDEVSKQPVTMYEYDEYTFILPERSDLEADIKANMTDWLVTGRTLEVNEGASIVQDMKAALEILGVKENA